MTKIIILMIGLYSLLIGYPAQAVNAINGDGYYCVGQGYIAFKLIDDDIYSPNKHHTLNIVYLNDRMTTATVNLSIFQVLGMACSDNKVLLQSQDQLFTFALRSRNSPTQLLATRSIENGRQVIAIPKRLYWDHFPTNEVIVLASTASKSVFELWFSYKSRVMLQEKQRVIYHQNMAEIVKMNKAGVIQKRQLIFEKTLEEPLTSDTKVMM